MQRAEAKSERISPMTVYTARVEKSSQVFMVMLAFTMLAAPERLEPVPELNALISPENIAFTATPTRIILKGERPF